MTTKPLTLSQMRKLLVVGIGMLMVFSGSAISLAQDETGEAGEEQNIVELFTGSFASTRELILYRKTADPYSITINGERFVDRAYFEIEATIDDQPISPDAQVTVEMEPQNNGESAMLDSAVTDQPRTYEAVYRASDGVYLAELTGIENPGMWLATVTIDDTAGVGTTAFTSRIYPRKPDAPVWFNIANIGVPIVVVLLILGVYRWRGVTLMRESPA